MNRYKILFKGRVQGVGFRFTSKTIADRLNLTGTVENLSDGNVLTYVQGDSDSIDDFIKSMHNQNFIKIDSYDLCEIEIKDKEEGFRIIG